MSDWAWTTTTTHYRDPRLCPGTETLPVNYSSGSGTLAEGSCNVCGWRGVLTGTVPAVVPAHLPASGGGR